MKREGVYLHHILDEMVFLEEQCSAITYDDLVHDEVLKRSVLRSIEVIGEATKHLPPSSGRLIPGFHGGGWPGCGTVSSMPISAWTGRSSGMC
nr:HepT-like ribonuclease domain-containing protein [Methanofollis aquaemaris]